MAGLRFTELQSRPVEFLDFTSLPLDVFQQLVPPFEAAFQARMAAWRMDAKPRTARRFTVYKNCPLPTPEDRLLFVLTYTLQVVQGRLFGMVQGKTNHIPPDLVVGRWPQRVRVAQALIFRRYPRRGRKTSHKITSTISTC